MAAVKIQHKNCLQSTLRKKIINKLFAGLGRSVLGKTVPSACGLGPYSRPPAQFFPIRTSRPANNIYILFNTNTPLQLKRFCQDPTTQDAVHKQTQLDFHHQMGSIAHCQNSKSPIMVLYVLKQKI